MKPNEMPFPECCEVARIHHLPCVHRMRERDNQIPRIMIREVPNRWPLPELKRDMQVSHATGELSDSLTVQDPSRRSVLPRQIGNGVIHPVDKQNDEKPTGAASAHSWAITPKDVGRKPTKTPSSTSQFYDQSKSCAMRKQSGPRNAMMHKIPLPPQQENCVAIIQWIDRPKYEIGVHQRQGL
jgi:hypothetical protein